MQGIARPIVEPIARPIAGSMADSNGSGEVTPYLGVSITQQPVNWVGLEGATAIFTVAASSGDASALSYQWQEDLAGTWTSMPGETGTNLSVLSVLIADNGRTFNCLVTNAVNTKTSNSASIAVSGATWFILDEDGNRTIDETATQFIVDERSQ